MFNGFHEFFPTDRFSPFIGGGIGIANVEVDADDIGKADDDDLMVGLRYTF
jgi:opacity protein-like surface antigen